MQQETMMNRLANTVAPETRYETELSDGKKVTFRINHWSPTKVYTRLPTIGKLFAIPVSMIFSSAQNGEETDLSESLPSALIYLFQTLDENGIMSVLNMLLEDVWFEDKQIIKDLDGLFKSNPELILELAMKVVEISYSPFLKKGLSGIFKGVVPVANLYNQTSPQL